MDGSVLFFKGDTCFGSLELEAIERKLPDRHTDSVHASTGHSSSDNHCNGNTKILLDFRCDTMLSAVIVTL